MSDETVGGEPRVDLSVALSRRELEVLEIASLGLTNGEMAERLGVSVHTVKFHLASIYRKLGVTNRTGAIAVAKGQLGHTHDDSKKERTMDLVLYLSVLWRHRYIVAAGFVLAVVLALIANAGQSETWKSQATMFVTQPGFPWGRANDQYRPGNATTDRPAVPATDPVRLANLTALYARLATSDPVRSQLAGAERGGGKVTVTAVGAPAYATPAVLPLLNLQATAPTPEQATALARRATAAFQRWLAQQQNQAGIAPGARVVVQVVTRASAATVAVAAGKTVPALVFIAIMAATLGLVFVLQNVRRPAADVSPGASSSGGVAVADPGPGVSRRRIA